MRCLLALAGLLALQSSVLCAADEAVLVEEEEAEEPARPVPMPPAPAAEEEAPAAAEADSRSEDPLLDADFPVQDLLHSPLRSSRFLKPVERKVLDTHLERRARKADLAQNSHEQALRIVQEADSAHRAATAEEAEARDEVARAKDRVRYEQSVLAEIHEEIEEADHATAPDTSQAMQEQEATVARASEEAADSERRLDEVKSSLQRAKRNLVVAQRQLSAAQLAHESYRAEHARAQRQRRLLDEADEERRSSAPLPPFGDYDTAGWDRVAHAAFEGALQGVAGGEARQPPHLVPNELSGFVHHALNPDAQPIPAAANTTIDERLAAFRKRNGFLQADRPRLFRGFLCRGGPLDFLRDLAKELRARHGGHDEL